MLFVEIADTPYKQQQGLMFRESLDENVGMLFKFESPQVLKFWGLNTYIPLDIAFINKENKIVHIDRIKPLCQKTVSSIDNCTMAIEVNEGFFRKNGISPGHIIEISKDDMGFDLIKFKK